MAALLSIKVELTLGTDIIEAIKEGGRLKRSLGVDVEFDFNGINVRVVSDYPNLVAARMLYHDAHTGSVIVV